MATGKLSSRFTIARPKLYGNRNRTKKLATGLRRDGSMRNPRCNAWIDEVNAYAFELNGTTFDDDTLMSYFEGYFYTPWILAQVLTGVRNPEWRMRGV